VGSKIYVVKWRRECRTAVDKKDTKNGRGDLVTLVWEETENHKDV
jgi:hypothetical protein